MGHCIRMLSVALTVTLLATVGRAAAQDSSAGEDPTWWESGGSPPPATQVPPATSDPDTLEPSVARARGRLVWEIRRVQRSDADLIPRVILEMVGGYGGGALGILIGYFLGSVLYPANCGAMSSALYAEWACSAGRATQVASWASLGTGLALGSTHDALGGMGTSRVGWGTAAGYAAFLALDLSIAAAIPDPAAADDFGAYFALALIPMLTATIAAELADDGEADAVRRTMAVLPSTTVLTDPTGRVVGAHASVTVIPP